jgi:hypothetical protein
MHALRESRASVFISHSHIDKAVARRVARRLRAHGVLIWMDERGLRKGDSLEPKIKDAINSSKAVVVIATKAAARSKWVKMELAHAGRMRPRIKVYPFFVEDVRKNSLFTSHLGFSVTDPHQIEQWVLELARELSGLELSSLPLEKEILREDLEALEDEEPAVGLLIDGFLTGEGLPLQQAESVVRMPFHILDFVLNALYDLTDDARRASVVSAVASLFHRTGAGGYVLERCLVAEKRAGLTKATETDTCILPIAVGTKLAANDLDEALRLLSLSETPDDHALKAFIRANGDALSEKQWKTVVRLLTHPRRKPQAFTMEAAFELLQRRPESEAVRLMWQRWIHDGLFDERDMGRERMMLAKLLKGAGQKPSLF